MQKLIKKTLIKIIILGTILCISLFLFLFYQWFDLQFLKINLASRTHSKIESQRVTYIPDSMYIGFDEALKKIASNEYDINKYNCVEFSNDLLNELKIIGIKATIVKGKKRIDSPIKHMWIAVWIEPQTGRFIKSDEGYIEVPE